MTLTPLHDAPPSSRGQQWARNPWYRAGMAGDAGALAVQAWGEEGASRMAWRGLWRGQRWATLMEVIAQGLIPDAAELGASTLFAHANVQLQTLRQALGHSDGRALAAQYPDAWHVPSAWGAPVLKAYHAQHALWQAVEHQCLELMEALLATFPTELSAEQREGWHGQALHHAIQRGWSEGVGFLAARMDSLVYPDRQGHPPLHHAARQGKMGLVQELVALGAPIDGLNRQGRTPLGEVLHAATLAMSSKNTTAHEGPRGVAIAALLSCGARIDAPQGKSGRAMTPLQWAHRHEPSLAGLMQQILMEQALNARLQELGKTPVDLAGQGRRRL